MDFLSSFADEKPTTSTSTAKAPGNVFSGLFDTAKAIGGGALTLAKDVGQGFARSTAAAGAGIAGIPEELSALIQNRAPAPGTGSLTPQGPIQQAIYGTDKPISFASTGAEIPFVKQGSAIAPLAGAIGSIADLTGAGDAAKKGLPIVEDAIKEGPPVIAKLIDALKGAKPGIKGLQEATTAERSARAANVSDVFAQGKGQAGYFQGLGKLKGEIAPEAKAFEPLKLDQPDVDQLFNQIQAHPQLDIYDKVTASNGLQKILTGTLPQKSQLSLMEQVFGSDLIKEVMKKRSLGDKIKDVVTEAVNIPRTLMTSFDLSAPLRQGIIPTVTHPVLAAGATKEMFKQVFSAKNFESWLDALPSHPMYQTAKDSGLYIADPRKFAGGLDAKEEKFMSNIVTKIPVLGHMVAASERAYVGYLNKIRFDTFNQLAVNFKKSGIEDPKTFADLADFVNNATGRGDLGKFERNAQMLNSTFFSPRLIAARFNMLNPLWYAKQSPPVRKEAIKTAAEFVGAGVSVLALAKAAGAQVETDPRSTDFGKIKVGNTRFDIWGGFQQWARVFSQLASGQKKTTSGDIVNLDAKKYPFTSRFDVAQQFALGKLAPVPALAVEMLQGQKMFGGDLSLSDQAVQNTIPMYIQDIHDAYGQFGPDAILGVGVPAFFGVGTQTYQDKSKGSDALSSFK